MEEVKEQKPAELSPEQIEKAQHESNKFVREKLAWIHYRMGSMQFYLEEAQIALETRGVLEAICIDLQKKIELVEPPPAPAENESRGGVTKTPYIVDVPAPAKEETNG